MRRSFLISVVVAFLLLSGLIYFLFAQNPAFDVIPLLVGNVVLAGLALFSFSIISKGLKSDNPNALVRAKYSGTLLKFFGCIGLLLVYVFVNDREIHRPTLFLFLGMYIVYAALEAVPLAKMAKEK